jgi:hypothetical protein
MEKNLQLHQRRNLKVRPFGNGLDTHWPQLAGGDRFLAANVE